MLKMTVLIIMLAITITYTAYLAIDDIREAFFYKKLNKKFKSK